MWKYRGDVFTNSRDFETLSDEYIKENGTLFDNVCWEDDDIYDKHESEGGKPFTGLLYETYDDGSIAFYGYVTDGIYDGEKVTFYKNGQMKSYCKMKLGGYYGKCYRWYEDGQLKEIREISEDRKHEWIKKWDEKGVLLEDCQLK